MTAKLANLYLIGAPKAGTTSVAAWLAQHPDVFWSTPKEPFYWASDYPGQRAHHGFNSLEDYATLYSSSEAQAVKWRGDGSTTYLYSTVAVRDIVREIVDAKFIVSVRNPVDLVVSYHRTQLIALNEDEQDFRRAWARSLRGERPGSEPLDLKLLNYQRVGEQGAALERVLESITRERLLVVVFDDLHESPQRVWRQITDFLSIDSAPEPQFVTKNQSNRTVRFPWLRKLVHRPPRPLRRPLTVARSTLGKSDSRVLRSIRSRLWQSAERPQVEEDTRRILSSYFAEDVRRLERLLDRELGW